MKSSSRLLLNWGSKVMKSDEGFSNMLDKTILIDCLNENVRLIQQKQNSKRAVFTALFFYIFLATTLS